MSQSVLCPSVELLEVIRQFHHRLDRVIQQHGWIGPNEQWRCPCALPLNNARYPTVIIYVDIARVKVWVPETRRREIKIFGDNARRS